MLVAVPQGQLIDEDGAESEAAGVDQPLRRHLTMHIEDAFERPFKFSIARERSSWKIRRTSTPASVCG